MGKNILSNRVAVVQVLTSLVFTAGFSTAAFSQSASPNPGGNLHSPIEVALDYIKNKEYEMRYQDAVNAVQSPNREHNLRFTYESDGFIAERRVIENETDQWQVGIFVDYLSRTHARNNTAVTPHPFEKGYLQIDQADQRVALGINPTVTIQYYNSPEGMRQNFLVPEPPEGNGDLELALNVLTLNFVVRY